MVHISRKTIWVSWDKYWTQTVENFMFYTKIFQLKVCVCYLNKNPRNWSFLKWKFNLNWELYSDGNCKQSDLVSCSFLPGGGDSADRLTTLFVCVKNHIGMDRFSILFSNTIVYKCVKIYKAMIRFNIICLVNIIIR
jgi:hypothetical protein